jgi:5-methyltetrahydrofolate--homocysteine methyltransferase
MGRANTKGEAWKKIVAEEFEPRLERYKAVAEESLLEPRVVYGYFPAAGSGDDVIVFDPQDPSREIARFTFARQVGGDHLCLADYLREPSAAARAT